MSLPQGVPEIWRKREWDRQTDPQLENMMPAATPVANAEA